MAGENVARALEDSVRAGFVSAEREVEVEVTVAKVGLNDDDAAGPEKIALRDETCAGSSSAPGESTFRDAGMMTDGALTVDGTRATEGFLVKNEAIFFIPVDDSDFAFFFKFFARFALHFLLLKCCES